MRTKGVKILGILFVLLIFVIICSNESYASEATVSANDCKVGEEFTVTVTIPQDASGYDIGGITVTFSDGSKSTAKRAVKANMDLSWPGNYSTTFTGKVAGNATISVNNIILVNSAQDVINSNATLEATISIVEENNSSSSNENDASSDNSSNNTDNTDTDNRSNETSGQDTSVILEFSDTNEKMYTVRRVNIRQSYGTDSNIIQTLPIGTEVTRTGVSKGTKNGYSWSRVSANGISGYIITGALTYDAPVEEEPTETQTPDENDSEEKPEEQPEEPENLDENKDELAKIAEKFGTIPEVGVNIMPYLFLGSCVTCIVMMGEVRRKIAK